MHLQHVLCKIIRSERHVIYLSVKIRQNDSDLYMIPDFFTMSVLRAYCNVMYVSG